MLFGPTVPGTETAGPCLTTGVIIVLSVTVPLKPFVGVMVREAMTDDPRCNVRFPGLIVIEKSGVGRATVKRSVTECAIPLPVATIVST